MSSFSSISKHFSVHLLSLSPEKCISAKIFSWFLEFVFVAVGSKSHMREKETNVEILWRVGDKYNNATQQTTELRGTSCARLSISTQKSTCSTLAGWCVTQIRSTDKNVNFVLCEILLYVNQVASNVCVSEFQCSSKRI